MQERLEPAQESWFIYYQSQDALKDLNDARDKLQKLEHDIKVCVLAKEGSESHKEAQAKRRTIVQSGIEARQSTVKSPKVKNRRASGRKVHQVWAHIQTAKSR